MNTTITRIAIIGILLTPLASFAQTATPLTRAQVRAQLVQIEKAGYNPARARDNNYPEDIQAAEARVAAQESAAAMAASGMGSGTGSSSQSGQSQSAHHDRSKLFEHH
ncbi:DUF4148 domain-containing protein [Paraburkholderia tagetis]|uniref:DUF4148 domain-containing protein n=1 Tax=Paraburkholderia tagetis TaxID=2913261 RepID=A0A9X1UP31_9BURK|nr:DUF4148 domain-containing protein [Paraburkholderia tagetis]MCG5078999.1 DUF4148 domain-containing protein [Paraburkholderia tagetis]